MRVCHYNILDGGVGRADPLAEVIAAQNPDVVTLVEAEDTDVLRRLAYRLKMDFVQGMGPKRASAVLTRHVLLDSVNHALVTPGAPRSCLEATVRIDGFAWRLAAVHFLPHASDEAETKRQAEANVLLGLFAEARAANRPHLLAGDFNANHPQQQVDVQQAHPRTRRDVEANGGELPRRVVPQFLAAGYTDLHHQGAGDAALSAEAGATFTTAHPQQRVDYVFGYAAKATHAYVEHHRLATYASDHYPVIVDVEPAGERRSG